MSSQDMWYSPNRLLSHNALLNICLSPRGNGKSFSGKQRIIKNWLKKGKQSVYVRRYVVEIDKIKDKFWNDVKPHYPDLDLTVNGNVGFINGEPVVYFVALSTSSSLKSDAFPNVDFIMFDEYVITKTQHSRYLKNEMTLLFDLMETIFRIRDNGVVLILGNAVSFVNPLFSFFDIVPKQDQRFQKFKDGLICLELFTSHAFIEKKKETRFGRLIEGTAYGNYAIENKALEDTADFIKERGSYKYKYMCCFKYNDFKIGVWYNLELDEYFCDEIIDLSNPHKYAMLMDELEEGFYYFKGYRNISYRIKNVKDAGAGGNIFFCSQEIKKIMQDRVLPYL